MSETTTSKIAKKSKQKVNNNRKQNKNNNGKNAWCSGQVRPDHPVLEAGERDRLETAFPNNPKSSKCTWYLVTGNKTK